MVAERFLSVYTFSDRVYEKMRDSRYKIEAVQIVFDAQAIL